MARKTLIASVVLAAAVSAFVFAGAAVGAPGGKSASAKLCRGWATLMDSTATPFANQGACVRYGVAGGAIYPLAEITVELCAVQQLPDGICAQATGSGLKPGSAMVTNFYKNDVLFSFASINVRRAAR